MATEEGLRYIDSDGHILEHPTAMPEYAPAQYRDRIWHVETDEAGEEWLLYNNRRTPANTMTIPPRTSSPRAVCPYGRSPTV